MATAKLPEVPANLPAPATSVRDDVLQSMEAFVGPRRWPRNPDGTLPPSAGDEMISISEGFAPVAIYLPKVMGRIKNIPQWEKGLAKPSVKAEWDSFFALLPKWIENVYTRLDEKNHTFKADEDASAESSEINWMKSRLGNLQTAIDFAAQEAITSTPGSSSSAQPDDVKKAVAEIDQQVQSTRNKLKEIASRGGATEPGPRLKGVFSAFRAYVKLWEEAKPGYTAVEQIPAEATKKAIDGFARDAETAWSNDNPGKTAPPARAESSTTPPKSENSEPAKAQAPSMGGDTWLLVAAVGLGAAALFFGKKR